MPGRAERRNWFSGVHWQRKILVCRSGREADARAKRWQKRWEKRQQKGEVSAGSKGSQKTAAGTDKVATEGEGRMKGDSRKEKRKKTVIVAISILFYSGMLLLALGARRKHEAGLPQVTVTTPVIKTFGEGELLSVACALPEKIAGSGTLFLVSEEMINGELRTVARETTGLELGRESGGYREIVSGVYMLSEVIVDGREGVQDGDEVLVKGEWIDDGK